MAKSRSLVTNLARVFDAAPRVVYVVVGLNSGTGDPTADPESGHPRIVYANEACLDWIDVPFGELKDTRLVYSSDPLSDPHEHRVRGLHPPPESAGSDHPVPFRVFCQNGPEQQWIDVWGMRIREPGKAKYDGAFLVVQTRGATQATIKPRENDQLHEILANLRLNSADRHSMDTLVGTSAFAKELERKTTAAFASPAIDLMICGPPGSGKEHVARTVFEQRNLDNPARLVPLHCQLADQAMVQETMRELGQRKSAHPDAADCLLLLDVDRLKPECQSELLEFLKLPGFLALRTIATSSIDIQDAIAAGFNSELASYLNTMTITLVPLVERLQDIPVLAQLFLEQQNVRSPNQLGGFEDDALQLLLEYHWPDNLDELQRCVMHAVDHAAGSLVSPDDIPDKIRNSVRALRVPESNPVEIVLTEYLESIECQLIKRALRQANGNKSRASKLLGISRPRLLRRISHFGLDQTDSADSRDAMVDPSVFEEADD